jgi:hypothetical protein
VRADPVERAEEREAQSVALAVRPDDAVEELLRAGVDPALLANRAVDQVRALLVELRVRTHPVHLGGGWKHDALAVTHRLLDDPEVLLEIELEDRERLPHVRRRRGDRDERQHDVALLDLIFDPLLVDGDVPFQIGEAGMAEERRDFVARDVEPGDDPLGRVQDPLGQGIADEAVDAEDQDPHEDTASERKWRASISF